MAKFNLSDVLANAAGRDLGQPGREQIEYIDIDLIDPDPRNFYELSDLDQLAANIELVGLQQPIRVRKHPENPDRWMIVSGHRRRAAIRQLVDEGKEQFRAVGCIVEKPAESDALQELRLIYANSDTRKLTPAEISQQAERVEMLLYELKEQGMEFPGRMRDHVAEACKVSKSKLGRLKVIRDNLIPAALAAFKSDSMSEDCAYKLAREPERVQAIIYGSKYNDSKYGLRAGQVDNAAQRIMAIDKISCDGSPCTNKNRMFDRSLRNDMYNPCRVCCAECGEFLKCGKVCDKLKERRAEIKKEQERLENERKQEEKARQLATETVREKLDAQEEALRAQRWVNWGKLRESEGLTLYELYGTMLGVKWLDDDDYREIVKLERGQQPSVSYYDPIEWMDYHCEIARFADDFGCTIDFLYGRTDTPRPPADALESATVWHDAAAGDLPEDGESVIAAVQYDVPHGIWVTEDLRFRDGKFIAYGADMPDDCRVFWQPSFDPKKIVP